MIGQMAIGTVSLGFNDLGRLVTPTFLFRNRFYLQLSPHCLKMNKKINVGSEKNFKTFVHGTWNPGLPSCGCKACETMVAKCELVL